jgi:large subunit ribosomal protein L5
MMENPMRELRVGKVVVNISVGASGDPLDSAMTILQQVTGQQPCQRVAKQTIRQFSLRKKEPMACIVTLRGERATTFLEKAFKAVDGVINPRSFDKQGNFAFGIREHIDIPGTRYDPRLGITGMDVMVTVERPGYGVSRRKRVKAKVGRSHRVTPEESKRYISETFGVKVGTDQ